MLSLQGAWVQFLVRELRSCLLCGAAKKKKKTSIIIKTALPTSKVKDNIKQYIEKGKQI